MDYSKEVRITLGRKIKELRVLENLSQKEVAERAELNRSYISALENGSKNVTLDILVKIAICLEVSLPQLFEAPANLSKTNVDLNDEILSSLFLKTGFFATVSALNPGLGLLGLASYAFNKSGKDLIKKYLNSKEEQEN
ncbi:MAG: helix-turn-helix transcriptional regulator [Gracilimonas sp.]